MDFVSRKSEVQQINHELIAARFNDDVFWCNMCNAQRSSLSTFPSQSLFRVFALLLVTVDDKYVVVEGTNSEQGYIGGAICAERSALVKLRFFDNYRVEKVVIATDNTAPISPGLLCREYMMSCCAPSTSVVMASCCGSIITSCPIGVLFPYPYAYRYKSRNEIDEFAKDFSSKVGGVGSLGELALSVFNRALENVAHDRDDKSHPLKLAAAVIFEDGSIEVAWQLKGLEYGCTMDPISQLIREMEKKRLCGTCHTKSQHESELDERGTSVEHMWTTKPQMVVMTDQYGVCHAPFAQARALLTEHGYGFVGVIVHNIETMRAEVVVAEALAPPPPGGKFLTSEDF